MEKHKEIILRVEINIKRQTNIKAPHVLLLLVLIEVLFIAVVILAMEPKQNAIKTIDVEVKPTPNITRVPIFPSRNR